VATVAHVTSINTFEKAVIAFTDNAPMRPQDPSIPVLVEVRQRLGSIPRYFLYLANDPMFAKIALDREIATVHEGEISRLNKELVAYATSVVTDALKRLGVTNEQLFEATNVASIFAKNATFSTALQLDPASA
jgi:hypothetical protein